MQNDVAVVGHNSHNISKVRITSLYFFVNFYIIVSEKLETKNYFRVFLKSHKENVFPLIL